MIAQKQKITSITITAAAFILISLFICASFFVSENLRKFYDFPPQKDGVADLNGFDLSVRGDGITTAGEWEFFYNKWIITDEIEGGPDFIINQPERWTGKELNGERLKNSGYASYRLTLLNVMPGTDIIVKPYTLPISYRIYINGELNNYSGTMSKSENAPTNTIDHPIPYKVIDGFSVEIVVEISFNKLGGWLSTFYIYDNNSHYANKSHNFINLTSYIMLGVTLAFVVFSFILNIGNGKTKKNLSLPLLMLSIFLHLLTTKEIFAILVPFFPRISYGFLFIMFFTTEQLIMLSLFIHLRLQNLLKINKLETGVFLSLFAVLTSAFYLLWGTDFQIIPITIILFMFVFLFYKMNISVLQKIKYSLLHLLMMFVLMSTHILESLDYLGLIAYGFAPGISMMFFLVIILISTLSYIIIRDNAAGALKAVTLEKEVGRIKHQALQSQIKPHFIFNTLSSIQALYEKDKRQGSEALAKFASHLRQNIDSDKNDLISFKQEIKNIMNYVELENLRLDKKLTLFLNIDYTAFEIPTLSLQPLVENAIKYAETQYKKDGYIRITSELFNGEITVAIIDNGIGFDISAVRKNATGFENCRERLKYLLGAEMEIRSVIGEGTIVTIKIPVKDKENESNCS